MILPGSSSAASHGCSLDAALSDVNCVESDSAAALHWRSTFSISAFSAALARSFSALTAASC
jgi:hypothetical protein